MAVGCGWQAFVAYVNVGCYYLIGVPVGVVLGFTFDLGAKVMIIAVVTAALCFNTHTHKMLEL